MTTISVFQYVTNPLAGSCSIKLPKELDDPWKGLINTQNIDDNECFKWSIVRYVYPANHHLARITKRNKEFAKKLDFKDKKYSVKIRDIHKIRKQTNKKNSISISVFGYANTEKHSLYVSKKSCEETHTDL